MTALLSPPHVAERERSRLAGFAPNWFASVMGTGIIANAAILLPVHVPGLAVLAAAAWVLATALLAGLIVTSINHLRRHPDVARGHHRNLAMIPFFGTVAMAVLTVGSGALLAGQPLIGLPAALALDTGLWTLGTAGALACATLIPYLMFTLHRPRLDDVYASWLLPVVPPVVAATAGAGLIAHLPAGQLRLTVELICGALLGITMVMAGVMIVLLWARLALRGLGAAQMVPSLWLVLGPLGSSITAGSLLAHDVGGPVMADAALLYGLPVLGFALAWMTIAAAITIRTVRRHLPFSLSWWSFTFPVGTVVTGTSELARGSHAVALDGLAVVLFALLIVAWVIVATRTARGTVDRTLLR